MTAKHFVPGILKLRLLIVLVSGGISSACAQSAWQKSLEELDKRHAKETVALNKRQILDLDAMIKKAVREGKVELANVMGSRKTDLESEVESLERNAPASGNMEAVSRKAARDLEGKIWNLEKTTNVKAISVKDAKVFATTPDGRMANSPQADKQALPRMFYGSRSDGDRSYYLFSPDLKQVLGLTGRSHTTMTEIKKP